MQVLVDSSLWIDYFKGVDDFKVNSAFALDYLIDNDLVVINDIILTELIPFLQVKKHTKPIELLRTVNRIELPIDWQGIVDLKVQCLNNGVNGVGIPDLIIAQNAIKNDCKVYSSDKHFRLLEQISDLQLYTPYRQ